MVPPAKKLEDLIHLAELCVDLLQQNEEHYAEVSPEVVLLTRLASVVVSYGFTPVINVVTIINRLFFPFETTFFVQRYNRKPFTRESFSLFSLCRFAWL